MIKSRRMSWAEHVARMGCGDVYAEFWCGKLGERDYLGDQGVDWRIILTWIFRKCNVGYGLDRAGGH
jgi:hypothetical protein